MESVALAALTLALGMVIGYEWGERRGKRMRAAAVSMMPDYDVDNPINQGQYARTVVEDGVTWTVYGGWRNGER